MEVDLPDDDQSIMVIVLNIIHGRNRLVPKHAHLEILTKLAILVDKCQMVEGVESFSSPWINDLGTKKPLPNGLPGGIEIDYQKTIHRWLAVSWVFRQSDEFCNITAAAIVACGANLANKLDAELPIPETVIGDPVRQISSKC